MSLDGTAAPGVSVGAVMRLVILACAVVLSAFTTCANTGPDGPGTGTIVSAKDTCPTGEVAALEGEAVAALAGADAGTPQRTGPSLKAPKPQFTSRLLVPPKKPGDSVSDFTGCLALAEATAEAGARFPVPPTTRGPQTDQVRVGPMGEGIVVSHDVSHACCLQGEVASSVEGTQVILTERLTGTACPCQCASTVRSAVGLSPGKYTVVVRVDEGGKVRDAFTGEVTVTK